MTLSLFKEIIMKNMNIHNAVLTLVASAILANCGGGGAASSININTPNTTNDGTISGHSILDSSSIADFSGSYDYSFILAKPDPDIGEFTVKTRNSSSMVFEHNYEVNGVNHIALGVAGILTDASALPSSGTLVLEGDTSFVLTSSTQAADISGDSQITLNFGTSSASLILNEFTQSGGSFEVDKIEIANIVMNGNGLSGGNLNLTYLGNASDFTTGQTGYTLNHQGNIFGSLADEAGGVFLATGDDSAVIGYYIAD